MQSVARDQGLADELVPLLVKELKAAKERAKDLELELANARLGSEVETDNPDQLKDYKQRTEAAEHAMEVLQKNFEEVSGENVKLRSVIQGMKETKVKVKQEIREAELTTLKVDVGVTTEPSEDQSETVRTLEDALETYYAKYKEEKESRKRYQKSCESLEGKLGRTEIQHRRLESRLDDAIQATQSIQKRMDEQESERMKAAQSGVLASELMDHLTYPICALRPHSQNLAPVCHEGAKLREYLASDPRSAECATNMLFLPGRSVMVGQGLQHAFAATPTYAYDYATNNLHKYKRSPPLGQTFSFFFRQREYIYYAGEYTLEELCPGDSDGAMLDCSTSGISLDALADATLLKFELGETKNAARRLIKKLYTSHILKILPLGLQCVGFNQALYSQLKTRFEVSLPMAKRKEIFASEEESKQKRRRVANTSF